MFPCFIWHLLCFLPCLAPVTDGQTYAVVIGIADYQALSYANGDLRFADQDARQVAAFLRSRAGGNVPASHIRLLTNQQASQAKVQQALTLFQRAMPEDRIIFYFSGHGVPDGFVPYDARPGHSPKMLTYQTIKAAFHDSRARTKLCIADACLSGGMTTQQTQARTLTQPKVQGTKADGNVAMILASRSTQSAVENGRLAGGAFTYYLLRGLTGQGDLDGNQIVTIRELHQYLAPRVKKVTRGRQTPIFYGRFSDNLALAYL